MVSALLCPTERHHRPHRRHHNATGRAPITTKRLPALKVIHNWTGGAPLPVENGSSSGIEQFVRGSFFPQRACQPPFGKMPGRDPSMPLDENPGRVEGLTPHLSVCVRLNAAG